MRLEFIDNVEEGEILGKSIFTNSGQTLLRKGIKLSSGYIKKLKTLKVFYIYVEDERLGDIDIEDEKLNYIRKDIAKIISGVMKNINGGNNSIDLKVSCEIIENIIESMMNLECINNGLMNIRTYDNYMFAHSIDVSIMSMFMGMDLGLSKEEIIDLGIASVLHDIGVLNIPKIAFKDPEGKYREKIKRHPIYGEQILSKNYSVSNRVIKGILEHHERDDGTGYPYKLKGKEISTIGKILGVCDSYDRLVSLKKTSIVKPNEAYNIILSKGGSSFDIETIKSFRRTFSVYPLGSCVRLSNGAEGYVISQNKGYPDRPIIRVIYDSNTKKEIPFYEIDLLKVLNLTICYIV